MNIAFLNDHTLKEHSGGAQVTNSIMIKKGRELGHEIDVITPKDLIENGKFADMKLDWDLTTTFDKRLEQYDLIILNNINAFKTEVIEWIIKNKKYITYNHDYGFCQYRNAKCGQCKVKCTPAKIFQDMFSNSLLNIFLSPLHLKIHEKFFGPTMRDAIYIPSPIEEGVFYPDKNIQHDAYLYAGTIMNHKGVSQILDFAETQKGKIFHFAGKAISKELMERIKEKHHYLGEIPFEEMPKLYRKYKNFMVNPLWDEPFGRSMCFHPSIKIFTQNGVKQIKDVQKGDMVLTHKGEFKPVIAKLINKNIKPLIKIRILGNTETLRLTDEHPLLTIKTKTCCKSKGYNSNCRLTCQRQKKGCKYKFYKDYKKEWIPARDLKKGDFLCIPKIKTSLPEYTDEFNELFMNNPELMRLAGYFIGDGCATNCNDGYSKRIEFYFNIKEKEYVDDVCSLVKKYFGVSCLTYKRKWKNCIIIVFVMTSLADYFQETFGKYAKNKTFPLWFLSLSRNHLSNFVLGLFRSDGCFYPKYKSMMYSTISLDLAYNLFNLLVKIGKSPKFNIRIAKKDMIKARRTMIKHKTMFGRDRDRISYEIDLHGDDVKEFLKCPNLSKTIVHTWSDEEYLYVPIRSIDNEDYIGDVFNLEVKDHNSYVAENVAVHNCEAILSGCTLVKFSKSNPTGMESYGISPTEMIDRCIKAPDKFWKEVEKIK